ncbi:MAG: adenylate/guanylate cyclase domain-containing protein [Chloroflexota bacterium]|nr:adenylate/guanylate cyclase domain-containing protein [Chloroflexota bacterium]
MSRETIDRSLSEEQWRDMLLNPRPVMRMRRVLGRLPSAPRCKWCTRPFGGLGGIVMSALRLGPWTKNGKYCTGCFRALRRSHGGAEVECSLLFADVRGSTPLAEQMRPRDFNRLMGRFYDTATDVLVRHDAIVDKFVGDEIIGIFVPAMAGQQHAARAIAAAIELLQRTGHADRRPWVPVGAGVNSGVAYVGAIGEGPDTELTAMGDTVNTTARLASVAGAGEIFVTDAAADNAQLASAATERRVLTLKGKSDLTSVRVLTVVTK